MWEIMSRIRNLSSGAPLQAPEMTTAEIHALTSVEDGMIVYNTDTRQLLTHVAGSWLAISNSGSSGTVTNVDTGVGLTGGPITGAGTIELADTAVVAGEYIAANITVDAQGRIVSATNGDIGTVDSIEGMVGQINVDSTDPTKPVVSLADTAVVAGEYIAANITVDAQGRIISATNGDIGAVDSVVGTQGQINVDSSDVANPVVSLADTAVVAGHYTGANITVDAQGRIISANSTTLSGTGGKINITPSWVLDRYNLNIDLADTAVVAGEYTAANITVDAQGRIISASSTSPEITTPHSIVTWGASGNLLDNSNTQIDNDGNMTLSGTVTASSFNSVGNLNIEESGKLRITSANQGVVQINANPELNTQSNVYFSQDLTFPGDSGIPGQILSTDGIGNLSWQSNVSSITSRDETIFIDTTDPINVDIELLPTGIAAGIYTNPSMITFDQYGRATSATNGPSTARGMIVLTSGSGVLGSLLPEGVTAAKVTVIGGGGNGGNTTSLTAVGSGGGAGGTAIRYVTDLSSSSTYSVGGAGAVSTFTTTAVSLTANGGGNGITATGTTVQPGGVGGTALGGSINISGQRGSNCSTSSTIGSGSGGNSVLNGAGFGVVMAGAGIAASINSGSGGSGAFKSATGTGGAGAAGIIIIEY